ncbi:d430f1e0-7a18-4f22-9182-24670dbc40d6 [Sclerotinia trifoliorum]|uniref:D430f1e0-7a18-4f22-9182-24670dbc40d6 n=1 Tax=Sclerotinia trifoliorum TaxID=28548 RepID=A0A8H2W5N9_9HELO|nr:d430f1e0-7a18-4f22-9182-24670dbc40d6 [Sclerotinia trifoliorum]
MCSNISILCPICKKVAAPPRVMECAEKSGSFVNAIPCETSDTKIFAMNPCVRCSNPERPSSPTRILTGDILRDRCWRIPEWHPTAPKDLNPSGVLPNWNSETLALKQTKEFFFEHIPRSHSLVLMNRQGLPSQRNGLPLCLVAGVKQRPARAYRRPAPVHQRPPRFTPATTSQRQRATIAWPPSAWNNRRRNNQLGPAPSTRASSLQANFAPEGTPTCLIPEGIRRQSRIQHEASLALPSLPESLRIQIPAEACAPAQPQNTKPIPSSATSIHSGYLLPGPSPQVETFSSVLLAQIPAHHDVRPILTPPPLRIPTRQQRVQERERRKTLDQIQERIRLRQERERQILESEQIREFQQREDQRSHSEATPSTIVNDVQFQSVGPVKSKRSFRLFPKLR